MPRFIGAVVSPVHNQTAFRELYEFSVKAPSDYGPNAVLRAFCTPEVEETHMANEIAELLGAEQEGDLIEVTLVEPSFDGGIVTFDLPVIVKFAAKQRGSEYIQIGMADLQECFDCDRYDAAEKFLELMLKSDCGRVCSDEEESDANLDGVSAG